MPHPYSSLPSRAFWRSAISDTPPLRRTGFWRPKFQFGKDEPVATLGSCFAQHISRALVAEGFSWLDADPPPPSMSPSLRAKFNFGIFSIRVGNIYSVALLRQWCDWALGNAVPPDDVWEADGRFFDPFRPVIEPNGYASREEVLQTRAQTIGACRTMLETCGVFVFTLGLTEAWVDTDTDVVYPMCPGTAAGEFDPERHRFRNYGYPEIHADLTAVIEMLRSVNPGVKVLLTVSPVPLTATASDEHVLVATTLSKSILRSVAGAIAGANDDVDYFPSFEIVSGFPFKAMFYEDNLREVTADGVGFVMKSFLAGLYGDETVAPQSARERLAGRGDRARKRRSRRVRHAERDDHVEPVDVVCEDMLLNEYGR